MVKLLCDCGREITNYDYVHFIDGSNAFDIICKDCVRRGT